MILVTGAAGFIGFHLCKRLLDLGKEVIGIDNLNNYYSKELKESRLLQLESYQNFIFYNLDISDLVSLKNLSNKYKFSIIINLAAQAGVRHSLLHPQEYITSNLVGFYNIIEIAIKQSVKHFIFASTSSVYGSNTNMPFHASDNTDHPVSLYAATKKSNEIISHSYSHMHGLPVTGLRFFTVYGPWGRPDMAYFIFADSISKGNPITVFNKGLLKRDFTYIDDIIEAIVRISYKPPSFNPFYDATHPDSSISSAPYRILNIGNSTPVMVKDLVSLIEIALDKKANIIYKDIQKGDVEATFADVEPLFHLTNFKPSTSVKFGIKSFIEWYKMYYNILL